MIIKRKYYEQNAQLDEWNFGECVVVDVVDRVVCQQPEIITKDSKCVLCVLLKFLMFLRNVCLNCTYDFYKGYVREVAITGVHVVRLLSVDISNVGHERTLTRANCVFPEITKY